MLGRTAALDSGISDEQPSALNPAVSLRIWSSTSRTSRGDGQMPSAVTFPSRESGSAALGCLTLLFPYFSTHIFFMGDKAFTVGLSLADRIARVGVTSVVLRFVDEKSYPLPGDILLLFEMLSGLWELGTTALRVLGVSGTLA